MSDKSARKTIVAKEVLEQAALLFARKGFASTSLQDVAEAIGLSRPALYYYYPSKNALLAAMVEDVTVAAVNMLAEIRNNVELGPEDGGHRPLLALPREGVRDQGEDVDPHRRQGIGAAGAARLRSVRPSSRRARRRWRSRPGSEPLSGTRLP